MYHEFTINNNDEGTPIGYIDGGKYNKKVVKIKKSDKKQNQEIVINDGKIIPFHMKQMGGYPNRIVIAGPSLCGKSHFARDLAIDYYDDYAEQGNKIVLFTAIPRFKDNIFACDMCRDMEEGDDKREKYPCFCSKIYRIKCDESLLTNPIDLDELSNSLCIFDDIDRHPVKEVAKELNLLRDKIMNSGRHDNIDLISIAQLLLQGHKSKCSNTNAFQVVGFGQSGGRYQMIEFLKRYMSIPKKTIEKIIALPSRFVVINNCEPMFCMHQGGAFIL